MHANHEEFGNFFFMIFLTHRDNGPIILIYVLSVDYFLSKSLFFVIKYKI